MTMLEVEPIAGESPDLRAALAEAGLPVDDLSEAGRRFYRFADHGIVAGYGGLELLGAVALIRSVVVLPQARARGVGRQVANALLQRAAAEGASSAYLLTTTAAPFFESLGFARVDRASAPTAILATREAASLCPSTATLLVRST